MGKFPTIQSSNQCHVKHDQATVSAISIYSSTIICYHQRISKPNVIREWRGKNHIKLINHRWRWNLFCVEKFCCHFLIDDNKVTEDRNYEIFYLFTTFATEMNDFISYFIRRHPFRCRENTKEERRKPLPYLLASQFSNEKLVFGLTLRWTYLIHHFWCGLHFRLNRK